ncbi:MAG: hypothetical protein R3F60_04165 [bacterium]
MQTTGARDGGVPAQDAASDGLRGRGALGLVAAIWLVFTAQAALPRVHGNAGLLTAILGASGLLLALGLLGARRGARLGLAFSFKRAHVAQACVHSGVYLYWGMYWPAVGAQVPLLLGQVLFLTTLEITASWLLGRRHRLGLGAVPIVFSTNLFMWYRDDFFVLQFAMLGVAWVTKEYIKWDRGGQRLHVFNPSGIALALSAYLLLATGHTDWTRAWEISQSLGYGPLAYENIFLMGLIVMTIVPVVLLTFGAAMTMLALGAAWTAWTGTFHFIDTGIPIAVFLGMNLLATDPVTTPHHRLGRLFAGMLYGAAVFFLYDALKLLGHGATADQPALVVTYFDKLLFLPVLNLLAPLLDRVARAVERVAGRAVPAPLRLNLVHQGIWAAAFVGLVLPATHDHPGRTPDYWRGPCEGGDAAACRHLLDLYGQQCRDGVAEACHNAAVMVEKGEGVAADAAGAAALYGQACEGGAGRACLALGTLTRSQGQPGLAFFARACEAGEADGCQEAAIETATADPAQARTFAQKACDGGRAAGCGALGGLLVRGLGGPRDPAAAAPLLERACAGKDGPACANLAVMYRRGDGVPADPARAERYRVQACEAGVQAACAWEKAN